MCPLPRTREGIDEAKVVLRDVFILERSKNHADVMEGTEVVSDVCRLRRCDPGVVAALDVDGEEKVAHGRVQEEPDMCVPAQSRGRISKPGSR